MDSVLPHNSYIIDYYRKNFLFISQKSIFLCGYSEKEALEMGHEFYAKILTPQNLKTLIEINKAGFDFFYEIPFEKKKDFTISYDLVLQRKDGTSFCVNHKLKPYIFTKDENVWLSVCCLIPSPNIKMGNVRSFFKNTNERYAYSFEDKKWHRLPSIVLSEAEKFIISETDKGSPEKALAAELGCSLSNIHYYKGMIMKKTGTKTMREAILFLHSNGII